MSGRQDSNLRPLAPEASALSTELRARAGGQRSAGPVSVPLVEIALISDTHLPRGERRVPRAALEICAAADLIVHAGDLSTLAVLRELESLGPPVLAVHGNADDAEVRERLPARASVDADGARIVVVHNGGPAKGRLERMRGRHPDAAAVVFGHSHVPLHETDPESGFQIFNPGSATDRRRAPTHTMGRATAAGGQLSFAHVDLGA